MRTLVLERFESVAATALHAPDGDPEGEAALATLEAARLDAERAAEEARATREMALVDAIRELARVVEQSRAGAIQAVCHEAGQSMVEMLPSLIEPVFSQEIAAASAELVGSAGVATASLKTSPEDAEIVIAALKHRMPIRPITIEPDPGMSPGQARLNWGDGGANFDGVHWARTMQRHLSAQLAAHTEQGTDE